MRQFPIMCNARTKSSPKLLAETPRQEPAVLVPEERALFHASCVIVGSLPALEKIRAPKTLRIIDFNRVFGYFLETVCRLC